MNGRTGVLFPFLIGAAAGAAVALLLAQKSGPELRASIGDGFDDMKDKVSGAVGARLKRAGAGIMDAGKTVQSFGKELQE